MIRSLMTGQGACSAGNDVFAEEVFPGVASISNTENEVESLRYFVVWLVHYG